MVIEDFLKFHCSLLATSCRKVRNAADIYRIEAPEFGKERRARQREIVRPRLFQSLDRVRRRPMQLTNFALARIPASSGSTITTSVRGLPSPRTRPCPNSSTAWLRPFAQFQSAQSSQCRSATIGLRGVGLGRDSSPWMIAFQARWNSDIQDGGHVPSGAHPAACTHGSDANARAVLSAAGDCNQ